MGTFESQNTRAGLISLVVSIVLLAVKFYAYELTHSTAVLSDALESIVNVVAAGLALWVLHYITQPADHEHPYGHGKMEYFSAAFEGGLIFFAAIAVFIEAGKALLSPKAPEELEMGLAVIAAAALFNLLLGIYLKKIGRKNNSSALEASGSHVLSDVWTTIGVILGLALVKISGWLWVDPFVSLLIAVQLGWTGVNIIRTAASGLMDEQDEKLSAEFCEAINKCRMPGVINIHNLRMIRSGNFQHIDAHIVIPEFWDVAEGHEATHEFEKQVMKAYPFDGEIAFHVDPCKKKYCRNCDLQECPIRRHAFEKLIISTPESIRQGPVYV
ncbi:MAG: cation diffusion facilitator family transporter [Pseudobdellovibrionaceae bacterium]